MSQDLSTGGSHATARPAPLSLDAAPIAAPAWVGRLSWALWEWGTTPYVILITIYVFAPYFSNVIVGDPVQGQALWGYLNGIAGIAVAVCAPALGAIADTGGRRKPWLAGLTLGMAPALGMLWFAMPGPEGLSIVTITVLIAIISVCYEFSTMFHNAMLTTVASEKEVGPLSGLGLALANAGSVLLLIGMLWGFALPGQVDLPFLPDAPLFGLDPAAHEPDRLAGPLVAVWAVVFTIPLLLFTPDRPRTGIGPGQAVRDGLASLMTTLRRLRHYSNIARFLLARMLFNDGKTAILVFAGVYASGIFGWGLLDLLIYSISLSVFAILGGLIGGAVDRWTGSRIALLIAIGMTMVGLIALVSITPETIFFTAYEGLDQPVWDGPFLKTLPELVYMMMGWTLAMSITAAYAAGRSMLARIAPLERMSEFFGLYAFSGKATAFVGPLMVGVITSLSGDQRIGFASVLLLLGAGMVVMIWVDEKRSPIAE